jgi:hypothetical protein
VVHDLLAFLAERMLEMNKEKQKEIKGFLGWLVGFVGAKVEDLTPKTKLQSYYEHDYEGFLAVLKKNRKKLAIDPARREPGAASRVQGIGGQTGAAAGANQADRRADRCDGLQAIRTDGIGDRDRGRKNFSILIPTSFCRQCHDGKDPKKLLSFLVRRF